MYPALVLGRRRGPNLPWDGERDVEARVRKNCGLVGGGVGAVVAIERWARIPDSTVGPPKDAALMMFEIAVRGVARCV